MPVKDQVQGVPEARAAGPIVVCGCSLMMEIVTAGLAEEAAMQVISVDATPEAALAQIAALEAKAVIIERQAHNGEVARALLAQGMVLITLDPEESVATVVDGSRIPVTSMTELAQVIQRALVLERAPLLA